MLVHKGGFWFNDADSLVHKGKGKKGRKVKTKKESFVFSNRAFPVGKKALLNSVCPSGGCNDKRSSISPSQAGPVFCRLLPVHALTVTGRLLQLASWILAILRVTLFLSLSRLLQRLLVMLLRFVEFVTVLFADLFLPLIWLLDPIFFVLLLVCVLLQVLGRAIRRMWCPSVDHVGVLLRILQAWRCMRLQMKVRESLDCVR